MNLKQKMKILVFTIVVICISTTISNAAIEIKPGTTAHTNISVDTSYNYCYNMRAFSSSLGANSLDPHLSTMADWGAAAYLGLSGYGYIRSQDGQAVTIDTNTYYSTTRNATGVMNFGTKPTQTANYKPSYDSGSTSMKASINALLTNKDTKYVDKFTDDVSSTTGGYGVIETAGWFACVSTWSTTGFEVRRNVVGYHTFYHSNTYYYGGTNGSITYRPVIWN